MKRDRKLTEHEMKASDSIRKKSERAPKNEKKELYIIV